MAIQQAFSPAFHDWKICYVYTQTVAHSSQSTWVIRWANQGLQAMIFHQSLVGDFTDFTQQNQQAPKSSNIDQRWNIGRSSPIASIFGVGWSFSKIPRDFNDVQCNFDATCTNRWRFSKAFPHCREDLILHAAFSGVWRGAPQSCGKPGTWPERMGAGILAGDRSSTFRSFWLVTCRYCIVRYSQYSLSDFQFPIVLLNKGINCESGGSVGPWQKLFLWLLAICLSPKAPEESQGISAGLNICWSSLISMLPCTKCRKVFFTCTSQLDFLLKRWGPRLWQSVVGITADSKLISVSYRN